ncbi:hypothetical protein M431DRAFT_186129 [Trichoderma harzianum CBS 226.95]|uniref:Uncharacterized protein n=1 Tax=Trichoderma harzianum CBS 226.95 TaxID=983964 RepID=A0A2T4AU14_TRIHA|nr:hypothetical protein M431DRAFT_186129 [Trichoderma harzianum CBS 226.95]PTB60557.1 hypothetical protein M431DRAFT_186129 [Trichoderma harzianum CBS 226.95]
MGILQWTRPGSSCEHAWRRWLLKKVINLDARDHLRWGLHETADADALPQTSPYRIPGVVCTATCYSSIFKLYMSVFMHVTIEDDKMVILVPLLEVHDITDKELPLPCAAHPGAIVTSRSVDFYFLFFFIFLHFLLLMFIVFYFSRICRATYLATFNRIGYISSPYVPRWKSFRVARHRRKGSPSQRAVRFFCTSIPSYMYSTLLPFFIHHLLCHPLTQAPCQ